MFRLSYSLTLLLLTVLCTCVLAQNPLDVFRFDHDGETVDMPTLMERSNTPAVSMAVDNGEMDSAFVAFTEEATPISTSTIFPVGAGSALPVCVAILQLVERGEISLDDPINSLLGDTPLANGDKRTVRDALHLKLRMGSEYKPAGFAAGEARPSLADVSRKFRFRSNRPVSKGTEYGGWVFLQLLLEQHYQAPLNEIIQRQVFKPLCLEQSFYTSELSPEQEQLAAMGHDKAGKMLPGGYRRYVALADAGLWTTASDYARLTRALLNVMAGEEGGVLRPETVKMALADRYGHRSLLFHLSDSGLPYWGGNAKGYYFTMQAHPAENWVSVVM
ncbi:MAG: serine hydrolase domain-containing protein, partial [Bacteroidota bacterium]